MSDEEKPVLYAFEMLAVQAQDDPYYYTRWDLAKPYTVVAATQPEAYEALWALLGPSDTHCHWTAEVKSVKDARLIPEPS